MKKEDFLKYAIYIPSLLIVLGCIFLETYYSSFNINIFGFITIQESLLAFLSNSVVIFIVAVFSLFHYYYVKITILPFDNYYDKLYNKLSSNVIKRRIILGIGGILLISLYGYVFILSVKWFEKRISISLLITVLLIIIITTKYVITKYLLVKYLKNPILNSTWVKGLYFFLITTVIVIGLALFKAEANKKITRHPEVIIYSNDSTISLKDSIIVIGKTEKFIFIHNNYDNSNIILPMEQVKLIKLMAK